MPEANEGLYDRIKGMVYGAIIGDALGAAFEFLDSARIERELGTPMARDYCAALQGSLLFRASRAFRPTTRLWRSRWCTPWLMKRRVLTALRSILRGT
jgi:hypothetical protein